VRDHYSDELPQKLAELALKRGGEDNLTVIVVSVTNGLEVRTSAKSGDTTSRPLGADTLPPV
jgi:serine/threonine protein phosphatase PrpC